MTACAQDTGKHSALAEPRGSGPHLRGAGPWYGDYSHVTRIAVTDFCHTLLILTHQDYRFRHTVRSMATPVVHCEFQPRETSDAGLRRGSLYWLVRCSPDVKRDYQSQHASRTSVPPFPSCTARFTWRNSRSYSAERSVPLDTMGPGLAHPPVKHCECWTYETEFQRKSRPRLDPSLIGCVVKECAQWLLAAAALFRVEFLASDCA